MKQVIIIGAGRSGTNMLRDLLTSMSGIGTWPCDEINYIWRHGNRSEASDELSPELATDTIRAYIQKQFQWVEAKYSSEFVVEKTCANSLRVPFVNAICPDARYVFIVRDGRDVVASGVKRWKAEFDLDYIVRKARFVPPIDIPYYGMRYAKHRISKWFSAERRLGSWGPRYVGIDDDLRLKELIEVAAIQWRNCVELADEALSGFDTSRVHRVRYEDFVTAPTENIGALFRFLQYDVQQEQIENLAKNVKTGSIGKWRAGLEEGDLSKFTANAGTCLAKHGYC